jgi:hypothetical protein
VSYALRLYDMLLLPTPHVFSADPLLVNVATWGTLAMELSLGILVWNKRLRPWILAAGVVMHTTIALTINVGFFTPAMFVLYLAFVPPTVVRDLPATIRRHLSRYRASERDRAGEAAVRPHEFALRFLSRGAAEFQGFRRQS